MMTYSEDAFTSRTSSAPTQNAGPVTQYVKTAFAVTMESYRQFSTVL